MGNRQDKHNYKELHHSRYDEPAEYGVINKENRINFGNILHDHSADNEYSCRIYICGITITPPIFAEFENDGFVIFDHTVNLFSLEHLGSDEHLHEDIDIHPNKVFYWYKDKPVDLVVKIIDIFVENEHRELQLNFLFKFTFIDGSMYREITGVLPESLSKPVFKDDNSDKKLFVDVNLTQNE